MFLKGVDRAKILPAMRVETLLRMACALLAAGWLGACGGGGDGGTAGTPAAAPRDQRAARPGRAVRRDDGSDGDAGAAGTTGPVGDTGGGGDGRPGRRAAAGGRPAGPVRRDDGVRRDDRRGGRRRARAAGGGASGTAAGGARRPGRRGAGRHRRRRRARRGRRWRGGAGGAAGSGGTLAVEFARGAHSPTAVMSRWPNPDNIAGQPAGWEYNHGIVLRGIEQVWRHTGDARYLTYIQHYTDGFVSANGSRHRSAIRRTTASTTCSLRSSCRCSTSRRGWRSTRPPPIRSTRTTTRSRRNPDGGYWHKQTLSQPDVAGQHLHGRAVPDALRDGVRDLRHVLHAIPCSSRRC